MKEEEVVVVEVFGEEQQQDRDGGSAIVSDYVRWDKHVTRTTLFSDQVTRGHSALEIGRAHV